MGFDISDQFIEKLESLIEEFQAVTGVNPDHSFSFYSNLFMLIPVAFTLQKKLKFFTFCIFYTMVCSMIYHYKCKRMTLCLDATGIVLMTGVFLYLSKYNTARLSLLCLPTYIYFLFGVMFWVMGSSYKNVGDMVNYDIYHGCWHILVAFSLMNFFYVYYYRNMHIE